MPPLSTNGDGDKNSDWYIFRCDKYVRLFKLRIFLVLPNANSSNTTLSILSDFRTKYIYFFFCITHIIWESHIIQKMIRFKVNRGNNAYIYYLYVCFIVHRIHSMKIDLVIYSISNLTKWRKIISLFRLVLLSSFLYAIRISNTRKKKRNCRTYFLFIQYRILNRFLFHTHQKKRSQNLPYVSFAFVAIHVDMGTRAS